MASRISNTTPVAYGKDTKPVKNKGYLAWLHQLPCVITGLTDIDAAHVNFPNPAYGAPGRGKGRKASDRWCLPLAKHLHRLQHQGNERDFWFQHFINPHVLCLTLWGLYCERGDDGLEEAERIITIQRGAGVR